MRVVLNLLILCAAIYIAQSTPEEKDARKGETDISANQKFIPYFFCNSRCSFLCFLREYWTGHCIVSRPNAIPTCLCTYARNGDTEYPDSEAAMIGNNHDFMNPTGNFGAAMFGNNHDFMNPFPEFNAKEENFYDEKLGMIKFEFLPNGPPGAKS